MSRPVQALPTCCVHLSALAVANARTPASQSACNKFPGTNAQVCEVCKKNDTIKARSNIFLIFPTLVFEVKNVQITQSFRWPFVPTTMSGAGSGAACGFLAVLITVTLTYAATQPGDAATHGLLAGPGSVFRASRPSGYPPSWATR
jgi:hypothetical protein